MRTVLWAVIGMIFLGSESIAGEIIRVEKKLLGSNFYIGDSLLEYDALNTVLSENEDAKAYVNIGKRYAFIGDVIGGAGVGVFIFGVGHSIVDRELKWPSLSLGIGSYVVAALFSNYFYDKNVRMAVDIHNRGTTGFRIQRDMHCHLTFTKAIP